jgi:hypothetical protein
LTFEASMPPATVLFEMRALGANADIPRARRHTETFRKA